MKTTLPFGLFVWLVMACLAVATPEDKAKYGPHPTDGFPQIIQRDDFATIKFIEALHQSLAPLVPPDTGQEFWQELQCDLTPDALIFHSKTRAKDVTVRLHEPQVTIGQQRFSNPATVTLFTTCLKVLTDAGAPKLKLRFTQFGTRGYKRRTLLEFPVGPRVLAIDSYSNGPKNGERLYVLDLDTVKESLLWAPPALAAPTGGTKTR